MGSTRDVSDPGRVVAAPALVGRDDDLAFLTAMLERSTVSGEALLLVGDPGVGKTALLQAAAQRAQERGIRVLHGGGFEVGEISLSGLVPALVPLMDVTESLPAWQRQAISVGVGLTDGRLAQPAVVGQAVLTLLMTAAAETPLLLVIDDAQWLDLYSAKVLSFVAPRLGGSHVALLAASRTEAAGRPGLAGVAHYQVTGLTRHASDVLLRSRHPGLAADVRHRVADEAQGNPLALLELPAALSGRQREALEGLPRVLPISERLRAVFAARIVALPDATRALLLIAALDGTPDLLVLGAAAATDDVLADLAPAERERLVLVDNDRHRVDFRHPLTRSAVVELSTAAERRTAHAALARALEGQPGRQAPHLAASVDRPDESVAALLERCARHLARRGEAASAVSAMTRAADLSPVAVDRSRRQAQAAFIGSDMAWQFDAMTALLDQARGAQLDSAGALHLAAAAAVIMANGDYDFEATHRLLSAAIEAHGGRYDVSDEGLVAAVSTLTMLCLFAGKPSLWEPCIAALGRLSPELPTGLRLQAMTQFDPARTALAVLDELDAAIAGLNDQADPEELLRIPTAAVYVDRLPGCRGALRRQISDDRDPSAAARIVVARMNLGVDAFRSGRWDEAWQLASDGLAACTAAGAGLYAQISRFQLAQLAAVRGEHELCRSLTDELSEWATPRGARLAQVFAWHARCLDALGRGEAEEAYQYAAAISPPGTFPAYESTALWVCMELVESAVLTGRREAAQAHVAAIEEHRIGALSTRLALVSEGSAGIAAADDDTAREHFERALGAGAAGRWPFDKARVQLAYGRRLSAARANLEARAVLQAALATFEQLGARPWASLVSRQLRGLNAWPAGRMSVAAALTPQEVEIAQLAAQGFTNRQIGARLHLSHRTVGTHLYRIFPKLGVTTRAALRDALSGDGGPGPSRHEGRPHERTPPRPGSTPHP